MRNKDDAELRPREGACDEAAVLRDAVELWVEDATLLDEAIEDDKLAAIVGAGRVRDGASGAFFAADEVVFVTEAAAGARVVLVVDVLVGTSASVALATEGAGRRVDCLFDAAEEGAWEELTATLAGIAVTWAGETATEVLRDLFEE